MSALPVPPHSYICIVDDDQPDRDLLRLVLESEGYSVEEASSGQEALRLLRRSPHRFVVLLDLRMPGLSGTEVLRQVAAEAPLATRHAFILISAWPDRPPELRALMSALSVPVVSKPFDIEELLEVIAQATKRIQIAS
jgi:CheY-like chemotaxis protein